MKINPYIYFNGNCAEAVAFYEKVFNAKAAVLKLKDTTRYGYTVPPERAELVAHANINLGDSMIQFCDCSESYPVSSFITISVETDSEVEVKRIFNALKEDGKISIEPTKTFWSECFCLVTDKFGISWIVLKAGECEK